MQKKDDIVLEEDEQQEAPESRGQEDKVGKLGEKKVAASEKVEKAKTVSDALDHSDGLQTSLELHQSNHCSIASSKKFVDEQKASIMPVPDENLPSFNVENPEDERKAETRSSLDNSLED